MGSAEQDLLCLCLQELTGLPGTSFVALHQPDCWAHDICTAHLYSHLPYGSAHSSAAQRGLPLRCQLFSSHCWNHPQKAFATIREAVERESIGHPSRSATPKASGTAFPSANALPSPFPSGASATRPVGLHTAAFHLRRFPTTPHAPPQSSAPLPSCRGSVPVLFRRRCRAGRPGLRGGAG